MSPFSRSTISFIVFLTVLKFSQSSVLGGKEQIINNSLRVRFEYVIPTEWTDSIMNQFKKTLAEYCSLRCASTNASLPPCNVKDFGKFEEENVKVHPQYPIEEFGDSTLMFYVELPTEYRAKKNEITIPKNVLNEIVLSNKEKIAMKLREAGNTKDSVTFRIAYIEEELVRDTASESLNMIIIPSACAFMLLLLLLVAIVEFYRSRRQDLHLKKTMDDSKKNPLVEKPSTSSGVAANGQVKDESVGALQSQQPPPTTNGNICELPDVAITQPPTS